MAIQFMVRSRMDILWNSKMNNLQFDSSEFHYHPIWSLNFIFTGVMEL